MPPLFYVPHENPAFDNAVSYLPADMIPKPPKRAGVAFQVPFIAVTMTPVTVAPVRVRNIGYCDTLSSLMLRETCFPIPTYVIVTDTIQSAYWITG